MRISTDKDDPGFHPNPFGTKVWLDGEEVRECITADDELGMVVCHELDENGYPFIRPGTGLIALKTLFGEVRIELGD